MNNKTFKEEVIKLGLNPTEDKMNKLNMYYQLLIEWNQKMNLTAITDEKEVYLKHFYDSLTINKIVDLTKINTLCDVGTGAGFPGIVIKIFFPNLKLTLIDSLGKRINFLKEVIKTLKLSDCEAIHIRAEEYAKKEREKFDLVTSRAVAPLNVLLEYSAPLAKINGLIIAMKGEKIEDVSNIANKLNIKIVDIKKFKLPIENSSRTLIKIKKIAKTNQKYPRKFSEIKKHPLA